MALGNNLQRVLSDLYGRVRLTGRSLALAIEAGAFAATQVQRRESDGFWSGRLVGQTPQAERIPGTPGGMVWRYLVAIASWEGLLLRVNELLGPQARDAVVRLAVPDGNDDALDSDVVAEVVVTALADPGFTLFARTRFAAPNVVGDLSAKVRGGVAFREPVPYSDHVDFLADLLVQEQELADLARLPGVLYTKEVQSPEAASLATHLAEQSATTSPTTALEALLASLAESRRVIRDSLSEGLQADTILGGLVESRLLPYAESRFVIAGMQQSSRSPSECPIWILHNEYGARRRRAELLGWGTFCRDDEALELVRRIAVSLTRASIPFWYLCAKSGLDVRRDWGGGDGTEVGLWPLPKCRGDGSHFVAIATRVEGRSFSSAMRFLMKARAVNPQACCVLVTDDWSEETAAALYGSATSHSPARAIAVLRSDGPRYPPQAFPFPLT
jgi:hypothetical protein